MRICPNPQCPYALRHGAPAQYRAGAPVCSDCATSLVDDGDPPAPAHPVGVGGLDAAARHGVAAPLVATLAVAAVVPLLARVPLPYVDIDALRALVGGKPFSTGAGLGAASLGSLGIAPWVTAAIIVEVVALAVPRLRQMRHDARRSRLVRTALVLGVLLAAVQAWTAVRALAVVGWGITAVAPDLAAPGPALVATITLVAASCLAPLAVLALRRFGVGSGWPVLASGAALTQVGGAVFVLLRGASFGGVAPLTVVLALACVAGPAFAVWRLVRPFDDDEHPDPDAAPRPSAGIVPAQVALGVASLVPLAAAASGASVPAGAPTLVILAALSTAVLLPICARAFTGPSSPRASSRVVARTVSLLVNAGLIAAWAVEERLRMPIVDVVVVAQLVATLQDVALELRARRARGPHASIAAHWRFADAARDLAALAGAGIHAVPRGAHYRALFHFFAPLVPVEVLVPVDDVERARAVLAAGAPNAPNAPTAPNARREHATQTVTLDRGKPGDADAASS